MPDKDPIFSPVSSLRLSDKVVEQIMTRLGCGDLKVGDKLPGERELARQFQVGRTSIREAFRALQALGIVEIRSGSSPVIISQAVAASPGSRWDWVIAQRENEIRNLIEVRGSLEPLAAARAALRGTKQDLELIEAAMQKMELATLEQDIVRIVSGDIEFHLRVAEASKNSTLLDINKHINQLLQESRYALLDVPGRAESSCVDHRQVFEAIRGHDSTAAADAMSQHIETVTAHVPELIESYHDKAKDHPMGTAKLSRMDLRR